MSTSLAERTREAVRAHPFLFDGLRAGVLNYTATARFLDVDGDDDAVATALRRYAEDLDSYRRESADAQVTMQRRVGISDAPDPDVLLTLGDVGVEPDGPYTAISASGDVPAGALGAVCHRLRANGIAVRAAAGVDGRLTVVVDNDAAVDALRRIEDAVDALPLGPQPRSDGSDR